MGRSIVRERCDFVSVIETLYRPEPDLEAWLAAVATSVDAVLHVDNGVGFGVLTHDDDLENRNLLVTAVSGSNVADVIASIAATREIERMPRDLFRLFYYPRTPVVTKESFSRELDRHEISAFEGYHRDFGLGNSMALFAFPAPGVIVLCWAPIRAKQALSRQELRLFHRFVAHSDSAFRLRTQPEQLVSAVVSPSGRLLHLAPAHEPQQHRERLAARVVSIEKSRLRAHRAGLDGALGWEALADGRFSVVPIDDTDGKRYYLLIQNAPSARPHARFTPREADVLRLTARGFTGKGIGYALGLSPATVSAALARAAAKVGLRSRVALTQVASALFGATAASAAPDTLTAAERDVLELLRRGLSNAEIAQLRARSAHTVANQVASILRKSGSPSRRALASGRRDPDG
ncbi:MAG: helix-turn-helix transcriptional regulator [Myxococcales bacterium]|nr:helix-turn-helix transcriptional regulator [Myxococcales bacterium]MCB9737320.1 helix-turn-helix transcriptional regulator [Deltaproteobacteria bacterium]